MKTPDPIEASRYALLLILANAETDETAFNKLLDELSTKPDLLRDGVDDILCTITVQLLKQLHPQDWLATIRLQLLNLDIDPDHYAKAPQ
ncbi:hypothetical protein [Pseudarthrobacter siccitolerans]